MIFQVVGVVEFSELSVENVQSIKSAKFEFPSRDSGGSFVTVVGPSSSGKSALMRAVQALLSNTSSVSSLLRAGEKKMVVTATREGIPVSLTRGASLSTYAVGEEQYTKAGTGVPEAVQEALGTSESDLHIRFQFDRPYLLSETSGQAASTLAALSHAHILRDAAAKATKQVRSESSTVSVLEGELVSLRADLEALGDVEQMRAQVEQMQAMVVEVRESVTKAAQTQGRAEAVSQAVEALASAQEAVPEVPDVQSVIEVVAQVQARAAEVSSLLSRIEVSKAAVSGYEPAAVEPIQEVFSALPALVERAAAVSTAVGSLQRSSKDKDRAALALEAALGDAYTVEGELHELRDSLKVCPTCGQDVVMGDK